MASAADDPFGQSVTTWLRSDPLRYAALATAAALQLPDWCLAAGFVRNLAWDKLHGYPHATPLADVDLVYFDPGDTSPARDAALEEKLQSALPLNWSVKNQARMHWRNGDPPYADTADAMSYWPEVETAVGARLVADGEIALIAPFGLSALRELTVTLNPKRPQPAAFQARIAAKRWLENWPRLRVIGGR